MAIQIMERINHMEVNMVEDTEDMEGNMVAIQGMVVIQDMLEALVALGDMVEALVDMVGMEATIKDSTEVTKEELHRTTAL